MFSHPVGRKAVRAASVLTLALGTGLTATIALPAMAGAAVPSATVTGGSGRSIVYTAAAGQTNQVTVRATAADGLARITYVIDDVVPIAIAPGDEDCAHPDSADRTKVTCTETTLESQDPYATLSVNLGDGNDTLTYDNVTDQAYYFAGIDLGPGKDGYTHAGGVDGNEIRGGSGNDTVRLGTAGNAIAGDGNDTVYGGESSIVLGQGGVDTIHLLGDESDADGGAGNDLLYGAAGRQRLNGGDGNDTVRAGAGSDFLYGGPGADILYGNSGDDTIYGNSGNDKLYGGPGRDTLSGGPGTDVERQD
ncbi:calcium-binding protein [Streptomyces sp. Y7]|uniref:calcium-binding protein n=1 Tax=Streptomyces sp. Y7 TaxID=3342392 RepID=UPI00371B8BA2